VRVDIVQLGIAADPPIFLQLTGGGPVSAACGAPGVDRALKLVRHSMWSAPQSCRLLPSIPRVAPSALAAHAAGERRPMMMTRRAERMARLWQMAPGNAGHRGNARSTVAPESACTCAQGRTNWGMIDLRTQESVGSGGERQKLVCSGRRTKERYRVD